MFKDSSGVFPEVEPLGQEAVPFLVFWGNSIPYDLTYKKESNEPNKWMSKIEPEEYNHGTDW